MRLKHLKEQMLVPKEEYIINQTVKIRGLDVLILSFTVEKDKNCLWLIYEREEFIDNDFDEIYREGFSTNREELLYNIEASNIHICFHIEKMEIQGQVITFGSSSSTSIYDMNKEGIMQLQHFVEKGLISEEWDDLKLKNLVIAEYEQIEGETAPSIDNTKELAIKLYINPNSREVPIQYPFKVKFSKQDAGTKIMYYDEELDKENYFFINEIYSFDVYEDIKKKVEKIEDIEMRKRNLEIFEEALERICPKDKNLAVIKYETADNVQLNFYMKDYLEAEPIIHEDSGSIIWTSNDNEVGINGYKLRECVLQAVDKDFSGEMELELLSRVVDIPKEIVEGL